MFRTTTVGPVQKLMKVKHSTEVSTATMVYSRWIFDFLCTCLVPTYIMFFTWYVKLPLKFWITRINDSSVSPPVELTLLNIQIKHLFFGFLAEFLVIRLLVKARHLSCDMKNNCWYLQYIVVGWCLVLDAQRQITFFNNRNRPKAVLWLQKGDICG